MLSLKDFKATSIENTTGSILGGKDKIAVDAYSHAIETDTGIFQETWVYYDDGSVWYEMQGAIDPSGER